MTALPDRAPFGFRAALALLLTLPAAKAVLADSIDPDFFWHVRVAGQLLRDGIGPVAEPFSFMSSPGTWTPFSWLGELLMKWTYDAAGLRGIVGVHALCSTAFFGFVALACLEATRSIAGAPRRAATLVGVAFAMALSLPFLSFRPVTMALALMSAMTWLLWRDRRVGGRAVWWCVPATVLLTNLHLYAILFVAALWARTVGVALDAWASGRAPDAKRHAALAVGCSLAALCTPMLPGCVRDAIWFHRHDPMVAHALVAEITPFHAGAFGKALLLAVVATWAFALRSRRALGFERHAWRAAATVFLFQMGRFASVFALVGCPVLAATLPRLNDAVFARRSLGVACAALALFVTAKIAVAFPRRSTTMDAWLTRTGDADGLKYPTAAAAFVERDVPRRTGRLINELTWGGYLIWRLGDRYQVFMDGRTLCYPAAFWETLYVTGGETKRSLLAGQSADAAVLPLERSRLCAPLLELGWREAYRDARAVVLVPPGPDVATVDAP